MWPPGHFVVDLKENKKNHLGEKNSFVLLVVFFFFFFSYILEIQILSSLAESLLMGKSVSGWTV